MLFLKWFFLFFYKQGHLHLNTNDIFHLGYILNFMFFVVEDGPHFFCFVNFPVPFCIIREFLAAFKVTELGRTPRAGFNGFADFVFICSAKGALLFCMLA